MHPANRRKTNPLQSPPPPPSAAPLETPTNPGSAKGLRNSPCIATPDKANTPPTANPSSVRGKRICPRISSACSSPWASIGTPIHRNAALSVSSKGRLTGPSASESQIANTHSSANPTNSVFGLTKVLMGLAWPGTDKTRRTGPRGFVAGAAQAHRPARWDRPQTLARFWPLAWKPGSGSP